MSLIRVARAALLAASALALAASCAKPAEKSPAAPKGKASAAEAAAFVDTVEKTYTALNEEGARVGWVQATYINPDTDWLAAQFGEKFTRTAVDFANGTKRFNGLALDPVVARKLNIIRTGIVSPAPSTEGAAKELAEIQTRLGNAYSTGKIDFEGRKVAQDETEILMRTLKDPARLQEVWTKWHDNAAAMKTDYARFVEIANAGARELGFKDAGEMWRSGYDMDADDFATETDRLWGQAKPLYDELHCYVRGKLNDRYGDQVVPLDQPIRADLLGNMWAQSWASLSDVAAPKGKTGGVDLERILLAKGYTPEKMARTAEGFFTSLGFAPLPQTFWERSQIVKPPGREVVCHASAWNIDEKDDVRIKMCTKVNADDFLTLHHELGHNFYQRAYQKQTALHRNGANDGFHEAIGDMIALSITPEYMKQIGLIAVAPDASSDVGLLMDQALDKIAFLPWGLLVDRWRWEVFSGVVAPADYNAAWWRLREKYQGVRPPTNRAAGGFDPGAKYHVPAAVPYTRYFLAAILQVQFYKAACDQIGWKGPLHRCSFYGSKAVGEKFQKMLEMGASKPWPDALEAFAGTRRMDASAMLEYYAPLMTYLKAENKGKSCGW